MHQRSDFKKYKIAPCEFNCLIETDKENLDLKLSKVPIKKLKKDLNSILANEERQIDLEINYWSNFFIKFI